MQGTPDYRGLTGFEPISDVARKEFLEQGWLLIPNALTESHRQQLEEAVDRVYAEEIAAGKGTQDGTVHLLGFLTRDDLFANLLDHPTVFPYIWGLAGWNIYTHHNHLDVTPPALEPEKPYWGWHQDGYRQNSDPETMDPSLPRPMFSLKVAYLLSDLSETGRGATKIIPGSHLRNSLDRPKDLTVQNPDPEGTLEITARPGDAFIFDRRQWHSRSTNLSNITRKMLFVGYTYRWIRTLDELHFDPDGEWYRNRTPVQRQLIGDAPHTANYWGINWDGYVDDEIPLRKELKTRGLLDRSIPWLR
jgi:Phytanoyl-CoA dioxygenase (PhyH)